MSQQMKDGETYEIIEEEKEKEVEAEVSEASTSTIDVSSIEVSEASASASASANADTDGNVTDEDVPRTTRQDVRKILFFPFLILFLF